MKRLSFGIDPWSNLWHAVWTTLAFAASLAVWTTVDVPYREYGEDTSYLY